jgi:hypothetical protein
MITIDIDEYISEISNDDKYMNLTLDRRIFSIYRLMLT